MTRETVLACILAGALAGLAPGQASAGETGVFADEAAESAPPPVVFAEHPGETVLADNDSVAAGAVFADGPAETPSAPPSPDAGAGWVESNEVPPVLPPASEASAEARELVDRIRAGDYEDRTTAADQLAAMGPSVAPAVMPLLRDLNPVNRIFGVLVLRDAEARDAYPALLAALDDSSPKVRFHAALALRKMTGQDHGYRFNDAASYREKAIEQWEQALGTRRALPEARLAPPGKEKDDAEKAAMPFAGRKIETPLGPGMVAGPDGRPVPTEEAMQQLETGKASRPLETKPEEWLETTPGEWNWTFGERSPQARRDVPEKAEVLPHGDDVDYREIPLGGIRGFLWKWHLPKDEQLAKQRAEHPDAIIPSVWNKWRKTVPERTEKNNDAVQRLGLTEEEY